MSLRDLYEGSMHNILIVGGAGDMVSVAIQVMLQHDEDVNLTVMDYDPRRLIQKRNDLGNPFRAAFVQGDLFDENRMNDLVSRSDLVLNAAGPYYKTASPVLEICMHQKVNYCDLNDEADSSMDLIGMHERVRQAGIGAYIGNGASPGITNIWAKELLEELDEPIGVDTVWCTGDEGPIPYGRAVLAHTVGICGGHGEAVSYKNGRKVRIPSFVLGEKIRFSEPLGEYVVYELAHPEPVTIPHYYPYLKQVRNLGGVHPQPLNGLLRGLSQAVCQGLLTMDEAIDFIQAANVGKLGPLKCWKYAWAGMRQQVRKGECSSSDFGQFIVKGIFGKRYDYRGGIFVRAWGVKEGRMVTLVRRSAPTGPGEIFNTMARATGTPFAALSRMVLDGKVPREYQKGVFSSEAWVDVKTFYRYMEHYGAREPQLVEPMFEEKDHAPEMS
jgi:saccharopine dehydrogenase-like NADP-dependent oxidoreductase